MITKINPSNPNSAGQAATPSRYSVVTKAMQEQCSCFDVFFRVVGKCIAIINAWMHEVVNNLKYRLLDRTLYYSYHSENTDDEIRYMNVAKSIMKELPSLKGLTVDGDNPVVLTIRKYGDPTWKELFPLLIEKGIDLDMRKDEFGPNPLTLALHFTLHWPEQRSIYFDVAKTLIRAGASVNGISIRAQGALHTALKHINDPGWQELFRLFVEKGAELEEVSFGETPLAYAFRMANHYSFCKLLDKATPYLSAIKALIKASASVKGISIRSESPLHLAIRYQADPLWRELIPLLIEHRAELEAKDQDQNTPLALALSELLAHEGKQEQPYFAFIKMFLEAGASLKDLKFGDLKLSPLHLVVFHPDHPKWLELANLFVEHDVEMEAEDTLGNTALGTTLIYADGSITEQQRINYLNFAVFLIFNGAWIKNVGRFENGDTILHRAIAHASSPIWRQFFNLLIAMGLRYKLDMDNNDQLNAAEFALFKAQSTSDETDQKDLLNHVITLINDGAMIEKIILLNQDESYYTSVVSNTNTQIWKKFLKPIIKDSIDEKFGIELPDEENLNYTLLDLVLMVALSEENRPFKIRLIESAKRLIRAGIPFKNSALAKLGTPLHIAAANADFKPWLDFLEFVLTNKIPIDLEEKNNADSTALELALFKAQMTSDEEKQASFLKAARMLLEAGATLEGIDLGSIEDLKPFSSKPWREISPLLKKKHLESQFKKPFHSPLRRASVVRLFTRRELNNF